MFSKRKMFGVMEEAAGKNPRVPDYSSGADTKELRDLWQVRLFDMKFLHLNKLQIICLDFTFPSSHASGALWTFFITAVFIILLCDFFD